MPLAPARSSNASIRESSRSSVATRSFPVVLNGMPCSCGELPGSRRTAAAQPGLQAAGFVVDARVDDPAVVPGLVPAEAGFLLQEQHAGTGAFAQEIPRRRDPHDPPADDDVVVHQLDPYPRSPVAIGPSNTRTRRRSPGAPEEGGRRSVRRGPRPGACLHAAARQGVGGRGAVGVHRQRHQELLALERSGHQRAAGHHCRRPRNLPEQGDLAEAVARPHGAQHVTVGRRHGFPLDDHVVEVARLALTENHGPRLEPLLADPGREVFHRDERQGREDR